MTGGGDHVLSYVAAVAVGFLLGSVPWALVLGKTIHGIDIRTRGSGNLGAANAFRILGPRTGLIVLLLDGGKGWGAVVLGQACGGGPAAGQATAVLGGLAAILGHVLSPWVGFRGGKGVATAAGVFLTLSPWATLIALLVWLVLMVATRYASVAAIGAAVALPFMVGLLDGSRGPALWMSVGVAALVVVRHRSNMRRLVAGEETRFMLRRPDRDDGRRDETEEPLSTEARDGVGGGRACV